eukprot:scaffold8667_cov112-Isochrysis_galbana.AAC.2
MASGIIIKVSLFHPLAAWRWSGRGRGHRLSAGELDRARHAALQLDETVIAVWNMRIPIAHWGGRGEVDFDGAPKNHGALDLDLLAHHVGLARVSVEPRVLAVFHGRRRPRVEHRGGVLFVHVARLAGARWSIEHRHLDFHIAFALGVHRGRKIFDGVGVLEVGVAAEAVSSTLARSISVLNGFIDLGEFCGRARMFGNADPEHLDRVAGSVVLAFDAIVIELLQGLVAASTPGRDYLVRAVLLGIIYKASRNLTTPHLVRLLRAAPHGHVAVHPVAADAAVAADAVVRVRERDREAAGFRDSLERGDLGSGRVVDLNEHLRDVTIPVGHLVRAAPVESSGRRCERESGIAVG